jgi:thiamine-phosphate pyrophosphorylase
MKFKIKNSKVKIADQNSKVSRIIDVNINRAVEGLRVMEEVVRFVLEEKRLSLRFKNIRGKLRKLVNKLLEGEIHFKHRKALKDIGRKVYTRSEARRRTILDIFVSNAKRVQEALRVLEEFSKLIKPDLGKSFKDIRFRIYDLEKRGYRDLKQGL